VIDTATRNQFHIVSGGDMMKIKILTIVACISLLGVLLVTPLYAKESQKITGGVFYQMLFGALPPTVDRTADSWAEFSINANPETGDVKGTYRWRAYNPITGWLSSFVEVECVSFGSDETGNYAVFSGLVTGGSWEDLHGMYTAIWVRDGGTPGSEGDEWGFYANCVGGVCSPGFTSNPGCSVDVLGQPTQLQPVLGGNLSIHE
jgi:hypothetical protein